MKDRIVIGSRESKLAMIQSEMVRDYLKTAYPEMDVEILSMKTTGDIILDRPLEVIGGKGLFVKELDKALMDGRTDISVHSLKDVPMVLPEELPLLGFSKREDPRDALVLPEGKSEIDFSKPIGCSSRRRILQLKEIFPEATFATIRGNVQTRIKKVDDGEFSATVLAVAGLKRSGLLHRANRFFSTEEMIPAAGQGTLAVQGKAGEDYEALQGFFDEEARICSTGERAVVRALGGDCSTPIAAYATVEGKEINISGFYMNEETGKVYRKQIKGPADQAEALGEKLGHMLAEDR